MLSLALRCCDCFVSQESKQDYTNQWQCQHFLKGARRKKITRARVIARMTEQEENEKWKTKKRTKMKVEQITKNINDYPCNRKQLLSSPVRSLTFWSSKAQVQEVLNVVSE
jgi:hypothetical protein